MRRIRIIPRLDVKGPNLVKGVHLEGLRVLGPPEYFAKRYYQEGADELLYMDVVASLYGRNNLHHIVKQTAQNVFIPITVGGGIRSVGDIRTILRAGADKVAINTAAVERPELIREGAETFGSQCIVVSIEAKLMPDGTYEALCDNGRQETGLDVMQWARHAAELGAGELLITSIDREGTGQGYDIPLVQQIAEAVSIPVIACGGAGCTEHVRDMIEQSQVCAVSAASIFHYKQLTRDLTAAEFAEGNIEFLKRFTEQPNYQLKRLQPASIGDVKSHVNASSTASIRIDSVVHEVTSHTVTIDVGQTSPHVVLVDYECGNLWSIEHALQEIGASYEISHDPAVVRKADRVILPGVGAFGDGMRALNARGLSEALRAYADKGKPLLGICLGMQLLLGIGEEFGHHEGLNLVPGTVVRLTSALDGGGHVAIPHIGWNTIQVGASEWGDTPLEDVPQDNHLYFVHSFMAVPDDRAHVLATTTYGPNAFCAVVSRGQVHGCQFHPERSGATGLNIYRRFVFGSCQDSSPLMMHE